MHTAGIEAAVWRFPCVQRRACEMARVQIVNLRAAFLLLVLLGTRDVC